MKIRKFILFFLLSILTIGLINDELYAINRKFSISQYSTNKGLAQSDVHDIAQDDRGFMWFATNDGICRYNGYSFDTFQDNNKTLGTNLILSLKVDVDQNLWIGTANEGLAMFDPKTEAITSILKLGNVPINQIEIDKYGRIAILVDNNKLIILSYDGNIANILLTTPNVYDIDVDENNELFALTDNKIFKINKDLSLDLVEIRGAQYLRSMLIKNGRTYVIDQNILKVINQDNSLTNISDLSVRKYTVTKKGDIWVNSADGIYIIESNSNNEYLEPKRVIESTAWFNNIFEDNAGVMWCSTYRKGVYKISAQTRIFSTINKGYSCEIVYNDSHSRLWVGTITGKLRCFNNNGEPINIDLGYDRNTYRFTSFIEHKSSGKFYLSDIEGVMSADVNKSKIYFETENELTSEKIGNIMMVLPDSNFLWIATYDKGLYLYDTNIDKLVNHITPRLDTDNGSLSSNIVRSIFKDKDSNIWIGTGGGLDFISAQERFKAIPEIISFDSSENSPAKLSYNYILPISQRKNGEIIVGTFGGGINIINTKDGSLKDLTCQFIDNNDGLSNNTIKAIVVDDNDNIWASTNKGIHKISSNNSITNYSIVDGLQDLEFCELSSTTLSNGKVVFGGVNGVNICTPSSINEKGIIPTVSFTKLYIRNKPISVGDKINDKVILKNTIRFTDAITLSKNDNSFMLEFTSINSQFQYSQDYRYKLVGFDKEYTYTDYRVATYTNIPAGRYKFIVEGSNDAKNWSEPCVLNIRIKHPIYFRWYANLFYLFLIIGIIYLISHILRVRRRQKIKIVKAQLEKNYIAKLSSERMDLITNISHELRTPLTLIISPLQNLIECFKEDEKMMKVLSGMNYNSQLLLRFVNMFMDYLKYNKGQANIELKTGNIVSLCENVVNQFQVLAKDKGVTLEFFTSYNNIELLFDHTQMEEVFYNLINNAIKYTSENGIVTVDVDYDHSEVIIRVSDMGVGIAYDIKEHIFERFFKAGELPNSSGVGLAITKNIIELHKGSINFTSQEGVGTTFIVTLPQNIDTKSSEIIDSLSLDDNTDNNTFSEIEDQVFLLEEVEEVAESISVLVVDDEPKIVSILNDLLSPKYQVIEAFDGEEALAKCRQYMPDVVISDIKMPKMNGIELCYAIKNDLATSHIPVIMLSTRNTKESQTSSLNVNADAYCSKPFDNKMLLAMVKSMVKNRKKLANKYKNSFLHNNAIESQSEEEDQFVNKTIEIIEKNMASPVMSVEFICEQLDISYIALNKKIKKITGHTISAFIRKIKMHKAAEMLKSNKYTVYEVTYAVGFNDLKHFRANFVKEFGQLPSEFTKKV